MRLLIVLILLPFITHGQIVRTHPYYKPAVSGCSYLLDQYSGAEVAFFLRKVNSSYSGPLIRVRRSSDNTEQDIGVTGDCGYLDTVSLKNFVGANNGYVVKWYNQGSGGASFDAANSTLSEQPQIVSSGNVIYYNGDIAIYGDGSSYNLTFTESISSNLIYVFSVASRISGGSSEGRLLGFSLGDQHDWASTNGWASITLSSVSNTFYNYRNNASGGSVSITIGNTYLLYSYLNGSTQGVAINGGSVSSASTSSTSVNISKVGILRAPWSGTGGQFKGYIKCLVYYKSDQSSNRTGIESIINSYYSIY